MSLGKRWKPPQSLEAQNILINVEDCKLEIKLSSNNSSLPLTSKQIPEVLATKRHSKIVGSCNMRHSIIVDRLSGEGDISSNTQSSLKCYGVFQKYPDGILNPSFTGMILWEIKHDHMLNNYKLCPYHYIKSGVILYGNMAYIFTPISNNDIKSSLKTLFRDKKLPNGNSPKTISKHLVDYIRHQASQTTIPSIGSIKKYLYHTFQVDETTFIDERYSFLLLLKRMYIMIYMIHYQMPLQRRNPPGSRNIGKSPNHQQKKGWLSYLSKKEIEIIFRKNTVIATTSIPDDLINGVCRSEITNFENVNLNDITNTSMFRDGSQMIV